MFETSRAQSAVRNRWFFVGVLPVSLALHAMAASAYIAADVWTVHFPLDAPSQFVAFALAEAAPPPPPPPPPPPAPAQQVAHVEEVKMPDDVAPTIIPDTIPLVLPPVQIASVAGVIGGVEGGVEGGEVGGVIGGTIGGIVLDAQPAPPPPPPPPDDGRVYIPRDEPLDLDVVSQPSPPYPFFAVAKRLQDSMVVRYVIDKNGRVSEVVMLNPPRNEIFVRGTLSTIRRWRFKPLVRNGERREVVHELTVNFQLINVRH